MNTTDVERVRALSETGLRFFGAMAASVSHEIRNKLAVINEKAGLVEDMAATIRTGRAADPDRLELQARKIVEQIRRANRIVQSLNRLAHSTDEVEALVDAAAVVALVAELYGRKAAMAQTAIESSGPSGGVELRTRPFLLANAVGLCLDMALAWADEGRRIAVVVEPAGDGAAVRIGGLTGVAGDRLAAEVERCGLEPLLDVLEAGLDPDADGGGLVLDISNSKQRDHGGQS